MAAPVFLPRERVMKVRIIRTFKGKDGVVREFKAGTTADIASKELLDVALKNKWAAIVLEEIDPFAITVPAPVEESPAEAKEYGLAAHEIALLNVKQLKAIIEEEKLDIDPKGLKQVELSKQVTEALKLIYKGIE